MKYKPYPYQQKAEQWILDKPACGLFLEMGLGPERQDSNYIERCKHFDV